MRTATCWRNLPGRRPAAARASTSLAHPTNRRFPELSAASGGHPTSPPTRTPIRASGSITSPTATVGALSAAPASRRRCGPVSSMPQAGFRRLARSSFRRSTATSGIRRISPTLLKAPAVLTKAIWPEPVGISAPAPAAPSAQKGNDLGLIAGVIAAAGTVHRRWVGPAVQT